ncbi:MAG TPA: TonB-dependent receptor [Stenotrophomonas sp.]|nr:TonB-dependent receptor [Stenotrophomonas sp.]
MEWRDQRYATTSDSNTRTGNFAGAGGPRPDVSGAYNVTEVFLEGALPIVTNAGPLDRLAADLGYRYSDYSTSGGVNTYKFGLTAALLDGRLRLRGGWNRAIRGPSVNALFRPQTLALWNGNDPCSGSKPEFSAEQCARTGVMAAQYGNVLPSPASQYNMLSGGNTQLAPERADTWTIGAAFSPVRNLDMSVDYYDIRIRDAITTIGASTVLRSCAQNGLPALCDRVQRNAQTGDLWVGNDRQNAGYVRNVFNNFGNFYYRGVDLSVRYRWTLGPGSLVADMVGSYALKQKNEPIPGVASATYDCAGRINESCNSPKWRHVANLRYNWSDYSVGLRWRYVGAVDYINTDGTRGTSDQLVAQNGGINAANYIDLNGSLRFGGGWEWTAGVNNVFDRAPPLVGSALIAQGNANSPNGYNPAGRYLFTSLAYRY